MQSRAALLATAGIKRATSSITERPPCCPHPRGARSRRARRPLVGRVAGVFSLVLLRQHRPAPHVHHPSPLVSPTTCSERATRPPIFHGVPTLSLVDGMRVLRLKLDDEKHGRMMTFAPRAQSLWPGRPYRRAANDSEADSVEASVVWLPNHPMAPGRAGDCHVALHFASYRRMLDPRLRSH